MANTKILVVEDESIVAKDIQKRLREMGHAVPDIAFSAEEAIKKAAMVHPDLVLMDIMLQGSMDGIEAAKEIRERFHIPVIYLTAYSDAQTLKRAEVTQPFGYILKPFEEKNLQIAIQMALYRHKIERQLKESQEWFATTLRCISDAVIATDKNGCITFINPVAETLTGWKQADAVGKALDTVFHIIHEETRAMIESPLTRLLDEGGVLGPSGHTLLIAKDGAETPIEVSAASIKDGGENILGVVLVFRDITQRREQVAAQEYQILHDSLTGLPNRNVFYNRLQEAIITGHRNQEPLALFFLELDRFKEMNQKLGRYIGDLLLQQVGQRLWDMIKNKDDVARVGGGQFTLLLPGVGQVEHATPIADKVIQVMEKPFVLEGQTLRVQVSLGIALFPEHSEDADTLVHQAYIAMDTAKQSGGGYTIYGQGKGSPRKRRGFHFFKRRSEAGS